MKKYLAVPAVALAAAAITSTASAHQVVRAMPLGGSTPVNMINQASMSWSQIRGFEPGVLQDANSYLRSWWGGRSVRFVNGGSAYQGWRVILTRKRFGNGVIGKHGVDRHGPIARVSVTAARAYGLPVSLAVSHELNEMMVDPYADSVTDDGYVVEVVDPVQDVYGTMKGVAVADFATPYWYSWGGGGPWDSASVLDTNHETTAGGYAPTLYLKHHDEAPKHLRQVTLTKGALGN
jgi:hypothetical protein